MIQMITVANPGAFNFKGKILIQFYRRVVQIPGNIEARTWIQKVELVEYEGNNKDGITKTFIIKFKDFAGREIKIYLSTKEIYTRNQEQWEDFKLDTQGAISKNEILWDDKNLFIIGEFHTTNRDPGIIDNYKYFITIDFINDSKRKQIIKFFSKERLNENIANDFNMPL